MTEVNKAKPSVNRKDRADDIKARAKGRWTGILEHLHVDSDILNGKQQPCPMCGGKDRFVYDDKFGNGEFFCRHCRKGDGFKLAMAVTGKGFGELLNEVEKYLGLGLAPSHTTQAVDDVAKAQFVRAEALRFLDEAVAITKGDEVDRYLTGRGLGRDVYPITLKFHPALPVFEKPAGGLRSVQVGVCAAMVSAIQAPNGDIIAIHRTYLKDGKKAFGGESKRVLGKGIEGAAIRLAAATDELAITEGVETGLAIAQSVGKPVWAAMNCGNMERIEIPASVKRVCIYADNDADSEFAGQVAAYGLAQRLVKEAKRDGLERVVKVFVPKADGTDWADAVAARG